MLFCLYLGSVGVNYYLDRNFNKKFKAKIEKEGYVYNPFVDFKDSETTKRLVGYLLPVLNLLNIGMHLFNSEGLYKITKKNYKEKNIIVKKDDLCNRACYYHEKSLNDNKDISIVKDIDFYKNEYNKLMTTERNILSDNSNVKVKKLSMKKR